jgi:hypothetical protein
MIRTVAALMVLLCSTALAGPVSVSDVDGDDKGWFYNRPGVTLAEAAADWQACQDFAVAMTGTRPTGYGAGLFTDVLDAIEDVGQGRAFADDCMTALGYRRFDTHDPDIRAFETRVHSMTEAEQLALVSDEAPPEGTLARSWSNTLWTRDPSDELSLERRLPRRPFAPVGATANSEYVEPLDPHQPISLAADQALVLITLGWDSPSHSRPGINFARVNETSGLPDAVPWGRSGRPTWVSIQADVGRRARGAGAPWTTHLAYVVPAGTYALMDAAASAGVFQLCLGTIAFTVEPGAVLDLGEVMIRPGSQESGTPFSLRFARPNLESDRALLAGAPDLAARLAAVQYRDEFTIACVPGYFPPYGIDLPGAGSSE